MCSDHGRHPAATDPPPHVFGTPTAAAATTPAGGTARTPPGSRRRRLWATLTHPRCDAALAQRVLGEVHMLRHQVGAAQRVEVARLDSLVLEHAAMARELAAAQERCRRLGADAARRAEDLEADRMRLRAQLIGRDSQIGDLRAQLAAQEAATPGLRERLELTHSVQQLTERNQDLQRALARARDDAERRFLHHDGGDEDSSARLDDTLGAADLVVCQTGCISHGAYWRVKDHCKRTGTPCLFVETPSRSALERALQEAAAATASSRGA